MFVPRRISTSLAFFVLTFLSLVGARPGEDSNTEQWVYYLYVPLFMAAVSTLLLMKSLEAKASTPVGCLPPAFRALAGCSHTPFIGDVL